MLKVKLIVFLVLLLGFSQANSNQTEKTDHYDKGSGTERGFYFYGTSKRGTPFTRIPLYPVMRLKIDVYKIQMMLSDNVIYLDCSSGYSIYRFTDHPSKVLIRIYYYINPRDGIFPAHPLDGIFEICPNSV